jgi:hypothetical protein
VNIRKKIILIHSSHRLLAREVALNANLLRCIKT